MPDSRAMQGPAWPQVGAETNGPQALHRTCVQLRWRKRKVSMKWS